MRRIIAVAALLILSLSACINPGPAVPTQGPPQATRAISPLPTPQAPVSPLGAPAGASLTPLPASTASAAIITTPSPDRATIAGILMTNPDAPQPVAGAVLALGDIIVNPNGTPMAGSFARTTAPRTETDAAGRFVFADVKAQKYVLVLDRITASYMLQDPNGKGDLVFDAQPGQVLDVGKLIYRSLPEGGSLP